MSAWPPLDHSKRGIVRAVIRLLRPQRVIENIECFHAHLKLQTFHDRKVLRQVCAVKVGAFQQEFVLPGNWFVPPGNNRSSSRGNEAVGAFGVKGRLSDSVSM